MGNAGANIAGMQGATAGGPFGIQGVSTVPQIQMAGGPAGNLVSPATFTDVPIVESGFPSGHTGF